MAILTQTIGANNSKYAQLLNKVPEVTAFFWIIKVLGTTVGETAADFLNVNLNFGLTGTSIATGILLVIAMFFQFSYKKYTPAIYWSTVVLISVFGTLVTDNLTDKLGVPLEASTIVFSVLLAATFSVWYFKEKTLSIHSIFTRRREAFYWLTILFTFALGTASGDLMAEGLGLGYLLTGAIVAMTIAILAMAWKLRLNSILAFWLIYILTRPLGASLGDLLSQPHKYGGLGLGATETSAIFLGAILCLVVYLTISKRDITTREIVEKYEMRTPERGNVPLQVTATLIILVALSLGGYYIKQSSLRAQIEAPSSPQVDSSSGTSSIAAPKIVSPLGDLSKFRTITQDTLDLVNRGDISGANVRVNDLEYEWDNSQSRLKPMSESKWSELDGKIDRVLRDLRSTNPSVDACKASLSDLFSVIG